MAARFSSFVPAILLVVLVGAVFGFLQGYGPENVLRRFHVAAVNRDLRGMQKASVENATPNSIASLGSDISAIARLGGTYHVYRIQKKDKVALAVVSYSIPGNSTTYLYVLQEQHGRWYVDPDSTIGLKSQKYGQSGSFR